MSDRFAASLQSTRERFLQNVDMDYLRAFVTRVSPIL